MPQGSGLDRRQCWGPMRGVQDLARRKNLEVWAGALEVPVGIWEVTGHESLELNRTALGTGKDLC